MLKLKKTAVIALVFASNTVFAGAMGSACTPGHVNVPCEHKGWSVGGQALYLQSSFGPFNFADYQTRNGVDEYINSNNAWNWGFMLEGAYHFSRGNDININWYQFNADRTTVVDGNTVSATTGSAHNGGDSQRIKPTWDAVNLEFGQHVDYNEALNVRYHGGFEYTRIDFKRFAYGFQGTVPATGRRTISYNGFGPRAGFDGLYNFKNGISVYTKGAVGMYAGTTHFHYTSTSVSVGARNGSSMMVVPEIEVKTGSSYTYSLARGDISLDGGWMWINYFNPMMSADDAKLHTSDFSLQGPYLGLRWLGDLV